MIASNIRTSIITRSLKLYYLKKVSIIIILIILLPFAQCTNCHFENIPPYFDIKKMQVDLLYEPNFSRFDTIKEGQMIYTNQLSRLYINFLVDYIAENSKSIFDGSLIACDPGSPGTSGSKYEKFQSIEIKTLTDYSEKYKAGANINAIFSIENYKSMTENLDSLITLNKNILWEFLHLKFLYPPTIPGPKQIEVNIELSTGENYYWISPRFTLL